MIPHIHFHDLLSSSTALREKAIQDLGQALAEVGFFALDQHGISELFFNRTYSLANQVFILEEDAKRAYTRSGLEGARGYTTFCRPDSHPDFDPEWKEGWTCGRLKFSSLGASPYPSNDWPNEVPGLAEVMSELYDSIEEIAFHLLDACSVFLGKPQSFLRNLAQEADSLLRILHYPTSSSDILPCIRTQAHEDLSLITLLCQPTLEGLELLDKSQNWCPVSTRSNVIVVNSGQMLHHLTGGYFKSTIHRVVSSNTPCPQRFSTPFFVQARPEADLTPFPEFFSSESIEKITVGEFMRRKLESLPKY